MKGDVTETIIVLGIGVIVLMTVGAAFVGLNQVNLPEDREQVLEGGLIEVSGQAANLADSCWVKADKGAHTNEKDCFTAKVYSNATIHRSNISEKLSKISQKKFGLEKPIPKGESNIKVTYHPVDGTVNISIISMCRPSNGDTCYSSSCSCQTSCMPGFDPDGDGTNETDAKGCVERYSFRSSSDPCDSISCSDPSIYRSGSYNGDILEIELEDSVGLLNTTLMKYPSMTDSREVELSSDSQVSPREVVGYGNSDRILFQNSARFNTSVLNSGQSYGLFIWGCGYEGGNVQNCQWRRPFLIN